MAVDNRPFKSKEQDGQGNEVIIRDQQLVEQGTATTMASGAYFETRDVDDRPVKIPRDNMMNIVLECIGIILNDSSRNLGNNVQKALGLQGNTVGHSTVADFASVLGVPKRTNCQGDGVYSLGNLAAYGSIRVIGVDFNQYKGNTDVSLYGNGNTANMAAIGTKGSMDFYKNGTEIFIKVPSGSSNNFIVIGAFPMSSTLPSGATAITVATS